MNTLPDNHISNETLWIYKENIEIFNKYNQQQVIQKPQEPIHTKPEPLQRKEEPVQIKKESLQKKEEPVQIKKEPLQRKEEPVQNKKEPLQKKEEPIQTNKEPLQKKEEPIQTKKEPLQKKEEPVQTKKEPLQRKEEPIQTKKTKIESPLDLIIRFTYVDKIMKQDIKNKLIDFISQPEFSKVFGMKKSSEIMTAITKDSWNQSISLFISFFLNKHVIYKEKSYSYYKNNEDAIITVC